MKRTTKILAAILAALLILVTVGALTLRASLEGILSGNDDGGPAVELTGRIEGVGSLRYAGPVSREDVRLDGLGSVERR